MPVAVQRRSLYEGRDWIAGPHASGTRQAAKNCRFPETLAQTLPRLLQSARRDIA